MKLSRKRSSVSNERRDDRIATDGMFDERRDCNCRKSNHGMQKTMIEIVLGAIEQTREGQRNEE